MCLRGVAVASPTKKRAAAHAHDRTRALDTKHTFLSFFFCAFNYIMYENQTGECEVIYYINNEHKSLYMFLDGWTELI